MKAICMVIWIQFLLLTSQCLADECAVQCDIYAFEITEKVNVEKFEKLYKEYGVYLERDQFLEITNIVNQISHTKVIAKDGNILTDDEYHAQYAQGQGGKFNLVRSELRVGLLCNLNVESVPAGGYIIRGMARYHEVSNREIFEHFPSLDAGYPTERMGGQFDSGLILPSKKVAKIIGNSTARHMGEATRVTGLILMIDRDTSKEDDSAYDVLFEEKN